MNQSRQNQKIDTQGIQYNNLYSSFLQATTTFANMNRALATFYGSLIGNAAGARLQGSANFTRRQVLLSMRLEGGGMAIGQYSYVGELNMLLASVLSRYSPKNKTYPLADVATSYRNWYYASATSEMLDIDSYRAFVCPLDSDESLEISMKRAASNNGLRSKNAGALLRVIPIAIWAHKMDDDTIAHFAMEDARLSHPNITCQIANATMAIAIARLITTNGNVTVMLNHVESYILKTGTPEIFKWMTKAVCMSNAPEAPFEERENIKWVFINAMWHLLHDSTFDDALYTTLYDNPSAASTVCAIVAAKNGIRFMEESVIQTNTEAICGISENLVNIISSAVPINTLEEYSNKNILPTIQALYSASL